MFLKKIALPVYILVIIMLAVFPFSQAGLKSVNTVYVVSFRLDHILHLLVFAPFYSLMAISFPPKTLTRNLLIVLVVIFISLAAEYVQFFLPYRTFNPADLLANFGGAVLGLMLWQVVKPFIR
jgi:VanZ family protein